MFCSTKPVTSLSDLSCPIVLRVSDAGCIERSWYNSFKPQSDAPGLSCLPFALVWLLARRVAPWLDQAIDGSETARRIRSARQGWSAAASASHSALSPASGSQLQDRSCHSCAPPSARTREVRG